MRACASINICVYVSLPLQLAAPVEHTNPSVAAPTVQYLKENLCLV